VVPGTNRATNRNAFDMIHRDTLFTNVALTADNEPWWEGRKLNTPVLDWQGKPFDPASGGVSAHPEFPFTVSARNNPIYSPRSEDAAGVPISAIVFGGRRREVAPLVTKHEAGSTGSSSAPRSHPKRPPPPRRGGHRAARPDGDETLRGLQLRRLLGPLAFSGQTPEEPTAGCSTSTGSAVTPTAGSCGLASGTTCGSWSGS
jgi:hypothetical protein